MHRRWGGPLVDHLQGDPEQNYATATTKPRRSTKDNVFLLLGAVAPADKARFLEVVLDAAVTSVNANHFGVLTAPATSQAIRAFRPRKRPTAA